MSWFRKLLFQILAHRGAFSDSNQSFFIVKPLPPLLQRVNTTRDSTVLKWIRSFLPISTRCESVRSLLPISTRCESKALISASSFVPLFLSRIKKVVFWIWYIIYILLLITAILPSPSADKVCLFYCALWDNQARPRLSLRSFHYVPPVGIPCLVRLDTCIQATIAFKHHLKAHTV